MESSTPGTFVLKVTPELMLKIASEQGFNTHTKPSQERHNKVKNKQQKQQALPSSPSPHPPPFEPPPFIPPSLPLPPPFASVVPPPPPPPPRPPHAPRDPILEAHAQKIADYSGLLDRTEKLVTELQKRGAAELDEINRRTQELTSKQYRAPIRSIPCVAEREACLQCYKENLKEPLKCKQSADAFLECARQAQKELASTVL